MKRPLFGFIGLVLALQLVGATAEGAQKNLQVQKDESLRRGETRTTLDPNMFKDPQV